MNSKEASNLIEMAINQALSSNENHDDSDVLLDWAVVAYVGNPHEGIGSGCPMFFPNGEIPTYRARGLFDTALVQLTIIDLMGHADGGESND